MFEEISATAIGKSATDDYFFALGLKDGKVKLARLDSLNCLIYEENCSKLPLEHNIEITKILFNQDATQMATASLDHTAKLWNLQHRTEDNIPLMEHKSWIWDMTYTHDKKHILTVSEDRTILKWFSELEELENHVQKLLNNLN